MADSLTFASSDEVLALLEKQPRRATRSEWDAFVEDALERVNRHGPAPAPKPVLVPRKGIPVELVISGGQTGADRAGLDAALAVGLPIDGYCPRGRLAEDGHIPERFGALRETAGDGYLERTALNVKQSVATMILCFDAELTGGTKRTLEFCKKHDRSCLVVTLHPTLHPSERKVAEVLGWLRKRSVRVLNVAGPRESKVPGIYGQALHFLTRVLGVEAEALPGLSDAGFDEINTTVTAYAQLEPPPYEVEVRGVPKAEDE